MSGSIDNIHNPMVVAIVCKRYRVEGTVQGVGFRFSTQRRARQLRLTGWVRNTPDGAVELVACGTGEQLQQLEDWLWRGPAAARVTQVVGHSDDPCRAPADFVIR